jgi:hypothetical protein
MTVISRRFGRVQSHDFRMHEERVNSGRVGGCEPSIINHFLSALPVKMDSSIGRACPPDDESAHAAGFRPNFRRKFRNPRLRFIGFHMNKVHVEAPAQSA